ncbi:MAG: Nif3-like dinuclear metal center hexameric protein [Rhodocyclaceae bacterium]|nr:Nif3-like dinuclear metal center hexameric protein [Rhodocyclaceae bacterium]
MLRNDLNTHLDELLAVSRFHDYCPNGLQVEGRPEIQRILCGVSASQMLLDKAVERQVDAVLVHHGWFWKNEERPVTGHRRTRLATLLNHHINLFAYHLPLDAHPLLGNNAELARHMNWTITGRFAEQDIGFLGTPASPENAATLAASLEHFLNRKPLVVGPLDRPITRLAWCSGGAQDYFEQAIAAGATAYVSGEISEQAVHIARETGIPYIAAGHHATERYGIMALANHLTQQFGIECEFADLENPV